MNTINSKGTTLVEVIVATTLLVSITGIITLALAAIFDGYALVKSRSVIDQDSQYILARMKYISSQQDSSIILSQSDSNSFTKTGFTSTNISYDDITAGLELTNPVFDGEYMSPIFVLPNSTQANLFVVSSKRPTGSTIKYQIAIAQQINNSCSQAQYVFVGKDKDPNTFFDADYFIPPTDTDGTGYENPGRCIRYKLFMKAGSGESPIVYQTIVKR